MARSRSVLIVLVASAFSVSAQESPKAPNGPNSLVVGSQLSMTVVVLRPLSRRDALTPSVLGRPLWFFCVLLAWLLTGLEWVLHQRRVVS